MDSWSEKLIKDIDNKLAGTKEKDLRFFRIAEFKRNIKRVEQYSNSCPECKKEQIYIAECVKNIGEAIGVPGKDRREYDRLISRLSKHMRKVHGFYAPYYFSYLYSFYGMIAGLFVGYVLFQIYPGLMLEMFSAGFAAGLISTYIWGSIKDKKIRSEKRLM